MSRYARILPAVCSLAFLFVTACGSEPATSSSSGGLRPGTAAHDAYPDNCTDQATCVGIPGVEQVYPEEVNVCKKYPAGVVGPAIRVKLDVITHTLPISSPTSLFYTIQPNSCLRLWYSNGGRAIPDTVTLQELLPGGYTSMTQIATGMNNSAGVFVSTPLGAPTSATTVNAITGGAGVPGILVVITNTPIPTANACPAGLIGSLLGPSVTNYLFLFTDGSTDVNWQGASKGFVGNVVVDGVLAKERTSGSFAYAGTISTNDATLSAWQSIVSNNPGQAFASTGQTALVSRMKSDLTSAFATINALPVTAGYASRSAASLDGLNTQNGVPETIVINVSSGLQVSSKIDITGDAGDLFILRWDTDQNFSNGYQGQVKFQSGGAIVPAGGLTAANFIHVAGDINASGGGSTPSAPYPQGPRFNNGLGALAAGAQNFNGGGFFTGYWLTTGDPVKHETSSLSNAIFVGGWYSTTVKFSMTSGTSGVHVSCP